MGFFTGLWKDWGKGKQAGPKSNKVAKPKLKKVNTRKKKKYPKRIETSLSG